MSVWQSISEICEFTEIRLAQNNSSYIFANMKIIQTLSICIAVALSAIVLGVSCCQSIGYQVSIETPFEEPLDGDSEKDFDDYKEYIVQNYSIAEAISDNSNHSTHYTVSHANQVKEIFTPPPKI